MPTHQFMAVPAVPGQLPDYRAFLGEHCHQTVGLSDEVCSYIADTLDWIPSRNPANEREWTGRGLNTYGPTIIEPAGAELGARIFTRWAKLFEQGPPQLLLTHSWERTPGQAQRKLYRITLTRDEVVVSLRGIAELCEIVAGGHHVLLHLGI